MKEIIFLIVFVAYPSTIFPQVVSWDYPLKPGTQDWSLLHNQRSKVQACQIPDDILTTLSSDDLIVLYLKYPLLFNILSFSTLHKGMDKQNLNFNGYNELTSSSNEPHLPFYRHLNISPDNFDPNWTSIRKGSFAFNIISLELILSQNEILQKLTYTDKKLLLTDAITKLDVKRKYVQVHDYLGLKSSCYLIISLLQEFNKVNQFSSPDQLDKLKTFSNTSSIQDNNKILQITQLCNNVIH